MRTHAPHAKLGTRSRPNASPRDPHIDVLRSCTRDEPIAAVANARGVVGAGRTADPRALTYYVT